MHSIYSKVVGSTDACGMRYSAVFGVQAHRTENIQRMDELVEQLLRNYYVETRAKPRHIVFFRDGVAETHYPQVNELEIGRDYSKGIRKALAKMYASETPPKLTVIVVAKRHHTRFFPENPRDGVGKPGNVPPGTTVDTGVVHPVENDWFTVSQFGALGTAKPTYYHVLCDDHKWGASFHLYSLYSFHPERLDNFFKQASIYF